MAQLVIPESSLASAFYEGCGKVFEFLGGVIQGWIDGAVNLVKGTIDAIGRGIAATAGALVAGAKIVGGWIGGVAKWLVNNPVTQGLMRGVSFIVSGVKLLGACLRGAYETNLGKWVAAAGLGFAGLLALKYVVPALGIKIFTPILLAPVARWLVRGVQGIWNFNWNVTDKEIEAQNKARIDALFGLLGGALGTVVGQVVCGAAPGVATVSINPRMLIHLKRELGEEVFQEVTQSLFGLARGAATAMRKNNFLNAYKNIRRIIKGYNEYPWFQQLIGERGSEIVRRWGEQGSKRFTFAESFENWIERIEDKDKRLGNFLEEFFEEAFENCGESLILWADSVDSFRYP